MYKVFYSPRVLVTWIVTNDDNTRGYREIYNNAFSDRRIFTAELYIFIRSKRVFRLSLIDCA